MSCCSASRSEDEAVRREVMRRRRVIRMARSQARHRSLSSVGRAPPLRPTTFPFHSLLNSEIAGFRFAEPSGNIRRIRPHLSQIRAARLASWLLHHRRRWPHVPETRTMRAQRRQKQRERSDADRKRAMERVVLTFLFAGAKRAARSVAPTTAALALFVLFWGVDLAAAQTAEVYNGGCVGGHGAFNCAARWAPAGDPYIRLVPQPLDEAAIASAKQHDRHWVDRCRPIVEPDRYGVPRYRYAQPGCQFGVGEN
jgi:hypothetical protein